jgi:hypothetical protein
LIHQSSHLLNDRKKLHDIQIARATFGQEPMVTEIQVIADDFQWTAEMNHPVIIQGVERFCIFIFCTFTAPVRGI